MATVKLGACVGGVASPAMKTHPQGSRVMCGLGVVLGLLAIGGLGAAQPSTKVGAADASSAVAKPEEKRMWMTVGDRRFAITLNDSETAHEFAAQLPLTLDMSELNGNEKHAELPKELPTNTSRPGTIRQGDLMLYGTKTVVVFYATFSSSYSYTRLGRVDDATGLANALGRSGARVTFSKN